MKDAVTKVIDTLTLEDFHGTFQKLLQLEEITKRKKEKKQMKTY